MPEHSLGGPHLPRDTPVATAFLDETGSISDDRFFAIGCLKLPEPAELLRAIQKWRDQRHWYKEIKFHNLTRDTLTTYKEIVDLFAAQADAELFCFVADRKDADPIQRFGTPWDAYAKLAEQLIVAAMHPGEVIAVLADNYSTPDDVLFEQALRASVNRRLDRLAVVSACRLDSRSSDGLQMVDLLTSAITFEFRQAAGLAKATSPKGQLAAHVRGVLGTGSCRKGWRNARFSIALYEHTSWVARTSQKRRIVTRP